MIYYPGRRSVAITKTSDVLQARLQKESKLGIVFELQESAADDVRPEEPATEQNTMQDQEPPRKIAKKDSSSGKKDNSSGKKDNSGGKKDYCKYNAIMVELREHLGKVGRLGRYAYAHLDYWAKGITDGKYSGPDDEPNWEKLEDELGEAPLPAGVMGQKKAKENENDFFQQYLIMQTEESKYFRTMMLAIMAKQNNQTGEGTSGEGTAVAPMKWDASKVKAYLDENGFNEISETFEANNIDGPTLLHLDRQTLEYLGISNALQQSRLLGKIDTLKKM